MLNLLEVIEARDCIVEFVAFVFLQTFFHFRNLIGESCLVELGHRACGIRQHRKALLRDFRKSAEHDDLFVFAADRDCQNARTDNSHDRRVTGEHAEVSLVAGIAHELNTPIGNAVTIASTLRDKSTDFESTVAAGTLRRSVLEDYTSTIAQGSELVLRNLSQAADLVANFKQVAVDQTTAQRRPFDLKEVIEEVLSTLHHLVRKKPIEVVTRLAPDIDMDSFPGPLGQVITNLFNNALIHGFADRNGGEIVIETRREGADRVILEVHDNGNGIPAENLGRVFDPFFTTRLGQGGSGLGLNIVHNIVTRLLGGRIEALSPVSGGTLFRLDLPRVVAAQNDDKKS